MQQADLNYQVILESMSEGVVVQKANGAISFCNHQAEAILGLTKDQMMGRTSIDPHWRSVHEDGTEFPGEQHPAMVTLKTGQPQHNVVMGVQKKDKSKVWIRINTVPVFDSNDKKPDAVISCFNDITEIKNEEMRYRFALTAVDEGLWDWYVPTGEVFFSHKWYEMLGYRPGELEAHVSTWEKLLHPEDQPETMKTLQEHLDGKTKQYETTHRLKHKDESYRWILDKGKVIERSTGGEPLRVIGTHRDLTDAVLLRRSLETSNARFRNLIQNFNEGILVETENRRILLVNQQFCKIFSIPTEPDELIGADCSQAAGQSKELFLDPDSFVKSVDHALQGGVTETGIELMMTDGTVLQRDYIPIYVDGDYKGHLWIYRDITRQKAYQEMITHKAFHDFLTGLPNRDFFLKKISVSLKQLKKTGRHAWLFYMDLDGFKPVNDDYGHDIGDKLLQEVAARFNHAIRRDDLIARMGGDEFALFIDTVQEKQRISEVAERMLQMITKPYIINNHTLTIGLSIGISVCPEDGLNPDELMKKADEALYAVKASGKNIYRFHGE